MERRTIRLVTECYPDRPAFDTAISRALLERVGQGAEPETLRLYLPGPILAFGPQDSASPGFAAAVQAAAEGGFAPIRRLAGGRAAVFHETTFAFSWTLPDANPVPGVRPRFALLADIIKRALVALGIDARVGEVHGEYCPGEFSVNANGRTKLMGVGQRMVSRAVHVGGVVVAADSYRIRNILLPVNAALGIEWDPATVGSVQDELGVLDCPAVAKAILAEFSARFDLVDGSLSPETLTLAERLEPQFHAAAPVTRGGP